jgi:hypothetical protein
MDQSGLVRPSPGTVMLRSNCLGSHGACGLGLKNDLFYVDWAMWVILAQSACTTCLSFEIGAKIGLNERNGIWTSNLSLKTLEACHFRGMLGQTVAPSMAGRMCPCCPNHASQSDFLCSGCATNFGCCTSPFSLVHMAIYVGNLDLFGLF